MKLKLLILLALTGTAQAQTTPTPSPRKITVYLAADGTQLPSAEGADHRADITMRDSVSGTMREYYPSGKTRRVAVFAHVQAGIRHGVETIFSESGAMLSRQEFKAGQADGELAAYYPEGSFKSRTYFLKGERVSQECYTRAGISQPCPPEDHPPQYPGGEVALVRTFMQKVSYPKEPVYLVVNGNPAKDSKGRPVQLDIAIVRLQLHIDTLGAITQTEVLTAPSDKWKEAVLKVMPKLTAFAPAIQNGRPIAQTVEVPLTFSLRQVSSSSRPVPSMYMPNLGEARGTREINSMRPPVMQQGGVAR